MDDKAREVFELSPAAQAVQDTAANHGITLVASEAEDIAQAALVSKRIFDENEAIEIASKAAWERDYPHGGSMVKTWADNSNHDRAIYAHEVRPIVRALLSKMGN